MLISSRQCTKQILIRLLATPRRILTASLLTHSFDEALGAHGFTKEHNLLRAHAYGAVDQFLADRSFGGRFVLKDGWLFFGENGGFFGVWDKIKDTMPDNNQQKPHKPGTAAAANPVCWTCKSSDLMMDWAYLGDPKAGAKWSRASNPVELVRNINHAFELQPLP